MASWQQTYSSHNSSRRRHRDGARYRHRLPHVEVQLELRHGLDVYPEQAVLRQPDERASPWDEGRKGAALTVVHGAAQGVRTDISCGEDVGGVWRLGSPAFKALSGRRVSRVVFQSGFFAEQNRDDDDDEYKRKMPSRPASFVAPSAGGVSLMDMS